jgi:predicted acylesterase/phospholipase RssA
LHGLAHLLPPEEVAWDVVSGVSAGSINSGAVAIWPKEKGLEMSEWLVETWMNMTTSKVYVKWPLGYLEGLFGHSGIYNN